MTSLEDCVGKTIEFARLSSEFVVIKYTDDSFFAATLDSEEDYGSQYVGIKTDAEILDYPLSLPCLEYGIITQKQLDRHKEETRRKQEKSMKDHELRLLNNLKRKYE